MNKTTFEVGKTYLTRDGSEILITSITNDLMNGVGTSQSGHMGLSTWYINGKYLFSGKAHMDLMPEEIPADSATLKKSINETLTETLATVGWSPPGWKTRKEATLQEENASLFKANLELLEEVDALQKENFGLRIELQEARMIAQGMVDAVKQDSIDYHMCLSDPAAVVKKGWINVYRNDFNIESQFCVYGAWDTKEQAEEYAGTEMYIGTFPFTFEVKKDAENLKTGS